MTRSKTKKKHAPRQYLGVMVSSTFHDLKRLRAVLLRAIRNQRLAEISMERDAALPIDLIDSSRQMVRDAAAYIGIIAKRYGQIPKSPRRNPKNISLTELEFDEAIRLRRPILLFIMGDRYRAVSSKPEPIASQRKLKAFRERAKAMGRGNKVHRVYATFQSSKEFVEQAVQSVSELRRYLEDIHGAREPARKSVRAATRAAKKAPGAPARRSVAAPAADIRFISTFEVDDVSVVGARLSNEKQPGGKVTITWPHQLVAMRSEVAQLVQAAQQPPGKRYAFSAWDSAEVAEWVEDAHEAIKHADEIMLNAHRGVESILTGMREHFHTRPDEAIRNFARLCVLAAGRDLADRLTLLTRGESLAEWRPYQNTSTTRAGQLRLLFGCKEPVWSVKLLSVSNFDLGVGEYFYGPKSRIVDYSQDSDAPINSSWFVRWIIPQLELLRVMRGKFTAVSYDQRATSSDKILDERAQEVSEIP